MTVFLADEQSRPLPLERLRALADHVLAAEGVPQAMEVTVLAVDADAIAELNRVHMGETGPTDVLAFPIDDVDEVGDGTVPAVLGDVVLCPAVAARQARDGEEAEVELLLVHGLLHLLGHDHADADERRVMFARTEALLAEFRSAHDGPAASGGADAGPGARKERP